MPLANSVNASQTGFQSLNAATGVWNGRSLTPGAGISITNQDGTGGNPVITATGMTPDPFGTVYLVDDFLYGAASSIGNMNWQAIGGSGDVAQNGTSTHPGIFRVGTNGTAGSIVMGGDSSGNTPNPIIIGGGAITADFLVNISATNNGTMCIGLGAGSTTGGAEPTSGVYFLYNSATNSGNWVGKTANASSRTSANSAVAVVGNTWVRLTITVNAAGTSASFFVNNVEIANSPLATNLPTASISPRLSNTGGTAGGGADLSIDLFVLTIALTTPR